jgi:hypothetical protein
MRWVQLQYRLLRCIMCGKRRKRRRAHPKTCGPTCRKRYSRWQAGQGPGPERFGGLVVERH